MSKFFVFLKKWFKRLNAVMQKLLGVAMILVGVVGLFLPVLPGVFLIVAGFLLLGYPKIMQSLKKASMVFIKFFMGH
jgi:uncharacterized protein YqgC (DUF456 family)